MSKTSQYEMTLNLNVLNHLGINLYSSVPAVLSEVVANAWDADATQVEIQIDKDEQMISISDNGHGMTRPDINNKYLNVGYERRKTRPVTPRFKRRVMGRKGIGKLSLFSIARRVQVYTKKGSAKCALALILDDIQREIRHGMGSYHPKSIGFPSGRFARGTRIVLTDLKRSLGQSVKALRKRLARRFSVIGAKDGFSVVINGEPISIADRDYVSKVQFVWCYGKESQNYRDAATNAIFEEKRSAVVDRKLGYRINGWIGTVGTSTDLKDESENLNKVCVMTRGKLSHEDLLEGFSEGGMYTKYLVGEIHAEFLDDDNEDDIATTSRQRIIEDDPRFRSLRRFVQKELKHIEKSWTDLRNKEGEQEARSIAAIDDWFKTLGKDNQRKARSFFGRINQIPFELKDRRRFFKLGVLAFESLRYRQNLDALEAITVENLEEFAKVFQEFDDIEATLYHQIITERLEVIQKLSQCVDDNALEKVIQKHLFDHLWLLDPMWERATETAYMEKRVAKEFDKIKARGSEKERKGRIDIKYKTTAGKHIIIELKRADVTINTGDLVSQISKYINVLEKLLRQVDRENEPIEVVCIVGKELRDARTASERERSRKTLAGLNARVVMYQELLERANRNYKQFLDAQTKAGRVTELIKSIDAAELF